MTRRRISSLNGTTFLRDDTCDTTTRAMRARTARGRRIFCRNGLSCDSTLSRKAVCSEPRDARAPVIRSSGSVVVEIIEQRHGETTLATAVFLLVEG